MQATGSVVFRVENEAAGKWEPRRLNEVHYSPNAHVNLIRLGYIRACVFNLVFNEDQNTAWLCKEGLKLRFDCHHMQYRLRSLRLVGAVEQRQNAMGLLHNRVGHVNMKLIKGLGQVDFGVNLNMKSLKDYECVPCLSAKFKPTMYKLGPDRREHPLEKLSVDLYSINQETATSEKMFILVVDEATRYKWYYLLKQTSDAAVFIKGLILRLNVQFQKAGHSVTTLH
ncbi:hypothetical protein PC121_g7216 [Phytophthora cactorum]|nr:hypothetical protein PC120_g3109 [Phytophthora cactorum]KAG3078399.1 hypothetical protein PC121_g7216 [Phytophthora cactorum]